MSLYDTQTTFKHMILTGEIAHPEQIFKRGGVSLEKRLHVYQNNYRMGLSQLLSETYQTVTALVGEKFMHQMSQHYACAHPPQKACLHEYGGDFPSFIEEYAPASSLPYLPDMARLDWAANSAYHAPDEEALSPQNLALIDLEEETLTLSLHPSVSLLSSSFPVSEIRHYVRNEQQHTQEAFHMRTQETYLLVSRHAYHVFIQDLTSAEYYFLEQNAPLMEAVEKALTAFPDFDFQTMLQKTLSCETFLVPVANIAKII